MNKSIENMANFYEKQSPNVEKSSDPLDDIRQRYKNDPDSLTNVELMTLGLERVNDIDDDQGDAEEEYVSNADYEKAKKAHDDVKKELETLKNESKN